MKSGLLAIPLIILFLFFRFYNLDQSFFFFNDMGRDSYTLQSWQESGKPPLLGPQTSALPINQSAIYFYLLYPAFLLTNQSPYYALYTSAFIYISLFLLCLYLSENNSILQKITLITFLLFSVHPQFIIQNRYIWNPSLTPPLILLSVTSFLLLITKFTKKHLAIFSLSLAAAVSLTYSIAPFLLALVILSFFYFKKHFFQFVLYLSSSLALLNLPTIFFELRHNFLLTKSLFSKNSPPQEDLSFLSKINNLSNFGVATPSATLNLILIVLTILLSFWLSQKNNKHKLIPQAFLLTLTITFIAPITLQAHYIFALLVLMFLVISLLPNLIILPIITILLFSYLNPSQIQSYFTPVTRTYSQMESCFQQVCSEFKSPTFSSVQSDLHPYHSGPEHRYLLKKSGCDLKEIEKEPDSANHMLIIEDSSTFTPQETQYYELSLFGKYEQKNTWDCQDKFRIVLIQKVN